MAQEIRINRENTNAEVVARIVKATSRHYDCSLNIDFSKGRRIVEFVGDEGCKAQILAHVRELFGE